MLFFTSPTQSSPSVWRKPSVSPRSRSSRAWWSPVWVTLSASSPIGLAATLDIAKAGDRIFMASFGSGAGSDAFDIEVTGMIESEEFRRDAAPSVEKLLSNPIYIDYARYARHKGKIVMQK
jgi:hydroxymethylglutaryl-CoA synthase